MSGYEMVFGATSPGTRMVPAGLFGACISRSPKQNRSNILPSKTKTVGYMKFQDGGQDDRHFRFLIAIFCSNYTYWTGHSKSSVKKYGLKGQRSRF